MRAKLFLVFLFFFKLLFEIGQKNPKDYAIRPLL